MISQTVREALQRFVPAEDLLMEEPMKNHTTFKVGGNAACFIEISPGVQTEKLLLYLKRVEIPYFIMGNGSNLLVSDKGYNGVILHFGRKMDEIRISGDHIYVAAGASLARVAAAAADQGLTGLEFAAGIPGTVGGAVMMNAGAYDGEMKQVVETVTVWTDEGDKLELDNETMEFGYRTSALKNHPFIVTSCTLCCKIGNQEEIRAKMADFQQRRREKQPLEFPSAGSTFKRPEGHFAGKLIMDAGLSGYQIGGAQVSPKHCGFVVNTGDATAKDIKDLIDYIRETVYEQFSVHLEPEVIMLGKF